MKREFTGYYAPTIDEYHKLWNQGTIVLDTNVLLDFYRLPDTARTELFSVLEILKDRLWIPHHVALEFQRQRLSVIAAERKATEDALKEANSLVKLVTDKFKELKVEERGLGIESGKLIDNLKASSAKIVSAIESVHNSLLDVANRDPVRDQLDILLDGKIGPPPENQDELSILVEGGDDRYAKKIPPGYEDAEKEKNPNEARLFHDDLVYERKYGDLIIWRQTLNYTKSQGIKCVLFVTGDRKEDWWWKEKGRIIGPRVELCREMTKKGGTELFWMYSNVQFLQNAKTYAGASVSEKSVSDMQEIAHSNSESQPEDDNKSRQHTVLRRWLGLAHASPKQVRASSFEAVALWISNRYGTIEERPNFPSFAATKEGESIGIEIFEVPTLSNPNDRSAISQLATLGQFAIDCDEFEKFTLVIVASEEDIAAMRKSKIMTKRIFSLYQDLSDNFPGIDFVLGYVDIIDEFNPVLST